MKHVAVSNAKFKGLNYKLCESPQRLLPIFDKIWILGENSKREKTLKCIKHNSILKSSYLTKEFKDLLIVQNKTQV